MSALPQQLIDWGQLTPLKIRAQHLASGLFSGVHRSNQRGSGVEFGGHRDYTPGDDLRRLDARALLRHGRLLVREYETETERHVCLMLDATSSMSFRSKPAPTTKLAYASLLAAALARITVSGGDQVSLDWLGGTNPLGLPGSGGKEAFERIVAALEHVETGGDSTLTSTSFQQQLGPVAKRAKRGSVVILLSDLIDLPSSAAQRFSELSNRDRRGITVQVLDPQEAQFSFEGAIRLRPSFGTQIVETDAASARTGYLEALSKLRQEWQDAMHVHQGQFITCQTTDDPISVLRQIVLAISGREPLGATQ